jgi:Circularly permutated YpsA SLOG family
MLAACRSFHRPFLAIMPADPDRLPYVTALIAEHRIVILNIAGNRESKARGIWKSVEQFLLKLFR